jgi:hypothetical protein
MDYLGHNVSQCVQANNLFDQTKCCDISLCPNDYAYDSDCVHGGWLEFEKYGFTYNSTSREALTWEQLTNQISGQSNSGGKPIAFSWGWSGGGGHLMVVKGYQIIDGENYVEILDPWIPCVGDYKIITYEYYVSCPGDHEHWDDFYDVTYVGNQE